MYGKWSTLDDWRVYVSSLPAHSSTNELSISLETSEPLYTDGTPFTIQACGCVYASNNKVNGTMLFWLIRANSASHSHELTYFADGAFGDDVYRTSLRMEVNKVLLSHAPSIVIKGIDASQVDALKAASLFKRAVYQKIMPAYPSPHPFQIIIDIDVSPEHDEIVSALRYEFGEKEGVSVKQLQPKGASIRLPRGVTHEY